MAHDTKLEVTFIADPVLNDSVSFNRFDGVTTISNQLTWQTTARIAKGQIQITTPTATPGEAAAIEYEKFQNLDYNASGIYTIVRVLNVVTITFTPDWSITLTSTTPFADEVVTPGTPQTYTLTSAVIAPASGAPCERVGVAIVTSENTTSYILNLIETTITPSTSFTVDIQRLEISILVVKNAAGETIDVAPGVGLPHFYAPKLMPIVNLDINVLNTPNGATVTATMSFPNQLQPQPDVFDLFYSLDDVIYVNTNIFTGQVNGSYTMYVRDNFGCTVSKDYEVTASGTREPYAFISNANSVTFARDEVWDTYLINKNDENTLSCTDLALLNYQENVLFQSQDKITIQFKSNYITNVAIFEEADDTQNILTVVKKSNNLNRFEGLDCTMYDAGNGQTGIYFITGNRYDSVGGIIGTYELNGNVPDFAIIDQYIEILTVGVFQITDVIFDAANNRRAIIFNNSYGGLPVLNLLTIYWLTRFMSLK